jgi:hypothetical protein
VTPNDYVYLGCLADQEDTIWDSKESKTVYGKPGLPSLLLRLYNEKNMDVTACASASKRAGKRFFGLQRDTCRAGISLINALRHTARPGMCDTLCGPDNICRGGSRQDPLVSTSLYVMKTGKGKLSAAVAAVAAELWAGELWAALHGQNAPAFLSVQT